MTGAEFVAVRGEFGAVFEADPDLNTAALAAAERQTDASAFGDDRTEAVMWLAAHILSADPLGKDARIVGKKAQETTLYLRERQRIEQLYAVGLGLVAGVPECP